MRFNKNIVISIILCTIIIIQNGFAWRYENPRILFFFVTSPIILFLVFYKSEFNFFKQQFNKLQIISIVSIGLILLSTIIGWYFSSYQYDASRELIFRWLFSIAFLLGYSFAKSDHILPYLVKTFITVMTFCSIWGILQFFGWLPVEDLSFPPNLIGLSGSKIDFIFILMPSIMFLFHYICHEKSKNKKLILLLFSIQIIAAILTNSRSIIILIPIFFIIYTTTSNFLFNSKKIKYSKNVALYTLFLLLLSLFLIWQQGFIDRIEQLFINKNGSTQSRVDFWEVAWKMFVESRYIGAGPGYFVSNQSSFWSNSLREIFPSFKTIENVHNDLLQTLCELGFVAFFSQFYIWFGALFITFRRMISKKSSTSLMIFSCLLMLFFHSSTNAASRHFLGGIYLWFFLGIVWGNSKNFKSESIKIKFPKASAITIFLLFHILLLVTSTQVIIGDYYYYQTVKLDNSNPKQSLYFLEKSLNYCPYHPETLFKISFILAQYGNFKNALDYTNRYEEIGGNLRPTNFVKSYCYLLAGNNKDALIYADKELHKWPKYTRPYIVKATAYSKLNMCDEKKLIEQKLKKLAQKERETIRINPKLGTFRKVLSGPYIKNRINNSKNLNEYNEFSKVYEYNKIKEISCNNN